MRIVGIYFFVYLFYMCVAAGVVTCVGVSMANADGGVSDQEVYRMVIREVLPALVYVLALFVLALAAMLSKNASVVRLAIERMFIFHFAWLPLIFIYQCIAPLAPELLSYYRSPGAITIRFVSSAWPFIMLSIFSYVCMAGWQTHNPELDKARV